MSQCPRCSATVPGGARFCPSCGAPARTSSQVPTQLAGGSPDRPKPPSGGGSPESPASGAGAGRDPSSSSPGSVSRERFTAGTVLAGRYRIVGRLGEGGMGEVYRADDLKLDQPVALKFLPEALSGNEAWMDRFLSEVRIARQISHANVCRVYDISEADGHPFISMEYVDGEDLASLLRRIGRYSKDKAVEIARQICAGLSAAHERGVLHRDLKPANIMIDGQGKVRITDFGLASLAGEVAGDEVRAGTPAYMAPEQLKGTEVTVRSDIYALGLVLYELFTGKHVHQAETREELIRSHSSGTVTAPTSHAGEIDEAAERIILKCLEKEPRDRPASALAVAAALPGGDPLAAALAAGETPSPAMVAAAGEAGALRPAVAWGLLGTAVVLLLLYAILTGWWQVTSYVELPLPPGALEARARQVLEELEHEAPAGDTAAAFGFDAGLLGWIRDRDHAADRWEALREIRPGPIHFWYRQSPRSMVPRGNFAVVSFSTPALDEQGMARVLLDPEGRLLRMEAVPARHRETRDVPGPPDWGRLFQEAGLEQSGFTETSSRWTPTVAADIQRAWEGSTAERPDITLRVEAAGYRGRPVYFEVIGPWQTPPRMTAATQGFLQWLAANLGTAIFTVGALGAGIFFAWRNIKAGRSDTRGALRVAFWFFLLHTAVWAVWASHVANLNAEWSIIQADVGYNLFLAASLWLLYVGLEPYVRRRWPDAIISWSRLLRGRLRDPMIGRDILIGGVLAGVFGLLTHLSEFMALAAGRPIFGPAPVDFQALTGLRWMVGRTMDELIHALLPVMQGLFVLLLLRIVLRKVSIAMAAFVLLVVLVQGGLAVEDPVALMAALIANILIAAAILFVLVRYGLVATTVGLYLANLLANLGLHLDFSAWYAPSMLLPVLAALALLAWGFRTALAGQPAFGTGSLLDG